jgi:hypothetical protein
MTLRSETTRELDKALFEVQKAALVAIKDRRNDHLKNSYATLGAVWDACREPLQANGVLVVQTPEYHERGIAVRTRLTHVPTGEWLECSLVMPTEKVTPQALGSAITYARRYALGAMMNILSEDDDGEAAMGRTQGSGRHDPPTRQAAPPAKAPASVDRKSIDAALQAIRDCKTRVAVENLGEKLDQAFPKGSPFRDEALNAYDARLAALSSERAA